MRAALSVVAAGVVLGACSSIRDVFSTSSATVAQVGTRQLRTDSLAAALQRVGATTPNPEAAELLAGFWVDLELLADRVAADGFKTDSVAIEAMIWPQIAEQKIAVWHDSVVAHRTQFRPETVDSVFTSGALGVFQQILIRVSDTLKDSVSARAQAERVKAQAQSANFGSLAVQYSEDATKADSGYLRPARKGALAPGFDAAAWALEPGQISGIVRSAFGFHIIRRPPLAEVRPRLTEYVRQLRTAQADSAYVVELTRRHQIVVQAGAAAVVRSTLADLRGARNSRRELVTLRDGSFTSADLIHWVSALPSQQVGQLRQAPDSSLNTLVKTLAQNSVLLREADSARVMIPPAIYQGLVRNFLDAMDSVRKVTGLDRPELSPGSATPAEQRKTLAVQGVEDYFRRFLGGQARYYPIPPTLSADLRASGDYQIYQAGISRVRELVVAPKSGGSPAKP